MAGSSSLASIGTWINANSNHQPSVKQPAPTPAAAHRLMASSSPQVNYYTENSTSGAKQSTTKSKKSKTKEMSNSKVQKSENDAQSSEEIPKPTSNGGPTLSAKSSKTKKGSEKVTGKSTSSTSDSRTPQEGKARKADKKGESEETPTNGKNVVTNGETSSPPTIIPDAGKGSSDESKNTIEAIESSIKATGAAAKSVKKDKKVSKKMAALEAELNDAEIQSPIEEKHSGGLLLVDDDDFPCMPVSSNRQVAKSKNTPKPVASSKNIKVTDDNFPSLSATTLNGRDSANGVSGVSLSHMSLNDPLMLSAPTNAVSKPPPGFATPAARVSAPPGLGAPPRTGAVTRPPGLGAPSAPLDISSLANLILPSSDVVRRALYMEPVNTVERNKKLKFKLKDLIHNNNDKFHKFKNLSFDFRTDVISAKEFDKQCKTLLGTDVYFEILPELLVLLPDLDKQQALYTLCIDELAEFQKGLSWSLKDRTLMQCNICNQVLLIHDANHHEIQHEMAEEGFPSMQIRSAW